MSSYITMDAQEVFNRASACISRIDSYRERKKLRLIQRYREQLETKRLAQRSRLWSRWFTRKDPVTNDDALIYLENLNNVPFHIDEFRWLEMNIDELSKRPNQLLAAAESLLSGNSLPYRDNNSVPLMQISIDDLNALNRFK